MCFFNPASLLIKIFMFNEASNVAYVFLNNTYKRQTESLFIFIYTITRSRCINNLCCIYVIYFSFLSSFSL